MNFFHTNRFFSKYKFLYINQDIFFINKNREVWLNSDTENTYKVCAPIGEDKTCIDSVPIWDWNGNDHTHYMNVASTSVISCSKASIY